ncbi:GntR family transcriptional regulator [Streptomyces sp.]|uniref:GntR family transcriptional regulator n=1 Tax=Streptomyces sp. TaxID=1931 RepID=UPI002D2BAE2A|nr:GntR family transcriptional regulator [Streptomyces sp.]HZF90321.1 GntR family transcriptional regulator [Streptomyces sp.]
MKQAAHGPAETGPGASADLPAGSGETSAARVPPQGRAAVSAPGRSGGDGAPARGEHTHSERPMPRTRPTAEPVRPVVQRSSVRGQILQALRSALVTGDLRPGEVYSAPALGERFGVSATPVREAMQQLALEGAVEVVPNRGFRVVERDARELAELAEVRALIEVPMLLRLARTVPAARWAELRPLAEATVRAAASGCGVTYAEADRAFHRAVLGLAGNAQLVRIADDLHRRAQWPLGGAAVGRARTALMADAAQHVGLLDALIAGDVEGVRVRVGEHFGAGAF